VASALEKVCAGVLKRTTPSSEERKRILTLAEDLEKRVEASAEKAKVRAEVRVEGSVAKDTWLSGEPDIDIFMRVPKTMPRKAFGIICLNIAKNATHGFKQTERFAEHPYLECIINNVRVNIVPCYKVERGEWLSATDRTPFHTDYVKPLLNKRLSGEIRLLKKFMKGTGVYGAEIKVGGFSGYLCELLTIHYGSFVETLKSVADWKRGEVIDYEGYYKGRETELRRVFEEPLIVVDPVDKGRNVAAAVSEKKLNEFISASRAFLKKPNLKFFFPPEVEAFNAEKLVQAIRIRGSALVFVKFGRVKAVPDVLWGQLYRSQKSLRKMLRHFDFNVIRDEVWSNEENVNMFIFELERRLLPSLKKHFGPPIEKREECERFLEKHAGAKWTISGPRVEDSRWIVEIQRGYTNIRELLVDKLEEGGKSVGIADMLSQAIAQSFEVLVNEEILGLYFSNAEFAEFLTKYLKGRPRWLD
jgi:tRNA nucleotidyltransferase (CCA-adding enzyme)